MVSFPKQSSTQISGSVSGLNSSSSPNSNRKSRSNPGSNFSSTPLPNSNLPQKFKPQTSPINNSPIRNLRRREQILPSTNDQSFSNNQPLRDKETNPTSTSKNLFTGSGKSSTQKKKKTKLSGKNLLKLAPIAIFLIIIVVVAVVSIGAVSLLPGHIDENSQEAFDVQYPAAKAAQIAITKEFLATGSIPTPFMNRLADAGVETGYLDKNNTFIAGLRPTSENSIALASSKNSSEKQTDNSLVFRFKDKIINASNFAEIIETDSELFSAFDDATYGRAIGHYDDSANAFYSTIKASRNVFQNYTTTGNQEEDTKNFREIFSSVFKNGTDTTSDSVRNTNEDIYDNSSSNINLSINVSENKEETINYLNTIYDNAKTFNDNQTASNMAMLINNAINANETYQAMHYYLTIEEAISKTKAGEGANSPINPVLNFLTESTTSKVADLENDGQLIEVTGSALQSPGMSSILTKTYSDSLSSETANYSSDRIIKAAEKVLSSDNEVNSSIRTTPLSVTTKSKSIIKDFSYSFINGINGAKSEAINTLVTLISPSISQSILFENAGEKLSGITAGEFFTKGGAALGQHIATFAQSGTIGDSEAIQAYNQYSENIIALEAAADRTKHPFYDITSKNTFLGSIFATISSNLASSSSLFSTFSSFSNLTNNSLVSIIPGASAASEENSSYQTTYSSCPALEQIGVKGDIYCNPTITFDTNTLKTALASAEFNDFLDKNLSLDTKSQNSVNLADAKEDVLNRVLDKQGKNNQDFKEDYIDKMIEQNNSRLSQFGVKDLNLYNGAKDKAGFLDNIQNAIKDIISSIGDFFSEPSSSENLTNWCEEHDSYLCFSTGSTFRNSSSNEEWENYKYAQAYVTYDRVLNQMEYFSENNKNSAALSQYFTPSTGESAVSTYLASFAEEVNNESDSEYLARISGMTKGKAEAVLAYVSYASYLSSLDYSSFCNPSESCPDTPEKPLLTASEEKFTKEPLLLEKEMIFNKKQEQKTTA